MASETYQVLWQSPDKQTTEFVAQSSEPPNVHKAYEWQAEVEKEHAASRPKGWRAIVVSSKSRLFLKQKAEK